MPKNYYLILGVSADSSVDDIKVAYRRLAKEFHPDYFGSNSSFFLAIQEAYSILSDPVQRRKYDTRLRKRSTKKVKINEQHPRNVHSSAYAEPLVPESMDAEPLSGESAWPVQSFRPSLHSLQNQWLSGISEIWDTDAANAKQLEVHVNISWEQAQLGGHVRIAIPVSVLCPECSRRGDAGYYSCWRCFDLGTLQGEIPILLSYPPVIENNHTVYISLDKYGYSGHLAVKFNVY